MVLAWFLSLCTCLFEPAYQAVQQRLIRARGAPASVSAIGEKGRPQARRWLNRQEIPLVLFFGWEPSKRYALHVRMGDVRNDRFSVDRLETAHARPNSLLPSLHDVRGARRVWVVSPAQLSCRRHFGRRPTRLGRATMLFCWTLL